VSLGANDLAAIARVLVSGKTAGTAFLIDTDLAITARHVVSGGGPIALRFGAARAENATVVHPRPLAGAAAQPDWALLRCKPPDGVAPLSLHEFDRFWNDDDWDSFGYGQLWVGAPPGSGAPGAMHGKVVATPLGLACDELKGEPASKAQGFSGAPMFVRGGVIGIITETRAAVDGAAPPAQREAALSRGGHLGILPARDIVADWPAEIDPGVPAVRPVLEVLPYVPALTAALERALTEECRRSLCKSLGLTGPVTDRRLAQRLMELPWDQTRAALGKTAGGKDPRVVRLVDAMWVPAGAAKNLRAVLDGQRPVAAIRTRREKTVRHHLMRAQGVDLTTTSIHWDDDAHAVKINNEHEAAEAVIEAYLRERFGGTADDQIAEMNDPDVEPVIFVLTATPADTSVSAIESKFRATRIVTYDKDMSEAYLQAKSLTAATLIRPFPDQALEKKSEIRDTQTQNKKGPP
jgi:hypothetical protein